MIIYNYCSDKALKPAIFCLPLHINILQILSSKQVVLFTGKTRKKSLANGVGCFRLATRLKYIDEL